MPQHTCLAERSHIVVADTSKSAQGNCFPEMAFILVYISV
jgi:hypothetical protein